MTTVGPMPAVSAARVADAMVRAPKRCDPDITVAQARAVLRNDHVHAVLLAAEDRLVAVVERADLQGVVPHCPARLVGRLAGRVVGPHADLAVIHAAMLGRRRRLAVVDDTGRLLGLLCLKRSGAGFCSDEDVAARAADVGSRPAALPAVPADHFGPRNVVG